METVIIDTCLPLAGVVFPLFCLGAVLMKDFFGRSRNNKKKTDFESLPNSTKNFDDEVRIQLLQQKINQFFQSVMANIQQEYLDLTKVINQMPRSAGLSDNLIVDNFANELPSYLRKAQEVEKITPLENKEHKSKNPYDKISKLINSGMDREEIAQSLGLPKSEVDLYIKFRMPDQNIREEEIYA